jgi:hypothetical protein
MPYTSEQRVFLYDSYVKYDLPESVGENFNVNFDINFVMKEFHQTNNSQFSE